MLIFYIIQGAEVMSNPISDGIKRLRYQHKLTPTKLSQMVDISHATLANMESGNSNPDINLVVNVAQALRVLTS